MLLIPIQKIKIIIWESPAVGRTHPTKISLQGPITMSSPALKTGHLTPITSPEKKAVWKWSIVLRSQKSYPISMGSVTELQSVEVRTTNPWREVHRVEAQEELWRTSPTMRKTVITGRSTVTTSRPGPTRNSSPRISTTRIRCSRLFRRMTRPQARDQLVLHHTFICPKEISCQSLVVLSTTVSILRMVAKCLPVKETQKSWWTSKIRVREILASVLTMHQRSHLSS